MNFEIYTDGACSKNPGKGGWAYIVIKDGEIAYMGSDGEDSTTNNRMELTAVIKSLQMLGGQSALENSHISVYSDSAYIMNCYAENWWKNWMESNWITANRKPVKNRDLWEQLIPFFKNPNITFIKVKGHADNEYNNLVDKMAVAARS